MFEFVESNSPQSHGLRWVGLVFLVVGGGGLMFASDHAWAYELAFIAGCSLCLETPIRNMLYRPKLFR